MRFIPITLVLPGVIDVRPLQGRDRITLQKKPSAFGEWFSLIILLRISRSMRLHHPRFRKSRW